MKRKQNRQKTSDALKLLDQLAGDNLALAEMIEQERANLDIARKIYELRTRAGLSQAQLARKVGTTQSVISRLEDADYTGHSLLMLQRIAAALHRRIEIHFVPASKQAA
jgi:ribosome-binding protein aMBF1 (putative translation factor)